MVADIRAGGSTSLRMIGPSSIPGACRGGRWHVSTVMNLVDRLGLREAACGMRQSRLMSLVEAGTNVAVGLLVAVTTEIVVFPMLGLRQAHQRHAS